VPPRDAPLLDAAEAGLQLASAGAAESESAVEAIDENVRIGEKSNLSSCIDSGN